MTKEIITCPKCGAEIELSEAISHNIEAEIKAKYEREIEMVKIAAKKEIATKDEEFRVKIEEEKKQLRIKTKNEIEETKRLELADLTEQLEIKSKQLEKAKQQELATFKKERELVEREKELQLQIEKQRKEIQEELRAEKNKLIEKAKEEAEEKSRLELIDLKNQLGEKSKKLEDAYRQELGLRKKQRELEEKEKTLEIEAIRKLDSEKQKIREDVLREAAEKHRLKEAEKDKQLGDMAKQIDELKHKAEQGSQQTQGEVLELEVEELLKSEFQFDDVLPVEKGIKGADILQTVKTQAGRICGKILWETKRTKRWSDAWLQKLKDDQREAKADLAVLVSETLPEGFRNFRKINNIWVADISSIISLATALRVILIQVWRAQQLQVGKNGKMEVVYNYLTGSEFKNRVEAIMEAFIAMQQDLDLEKRVMAKRWAVREKQITKVIDNIGGMHGDLEGMIGNSLPAVKALELSIEDKNENDKKDKVLRKDGDTILNS